ncbi:MAG: hypothetical protein Q7U97_00365 [Rhodocyclaceae bacterium]|nr:hypothetical protein [Rhodocyclaceae bacterium]
MTKRFIVSKRGIVGAKGDDGQMRRIAHSKFHRLGADAWPMNMKALEDVKDQARAERVAQIGTRNLLAVDFVVATYYMTTDRAAQFLRLPVEADRQ